MESQVLNAVLHGSLKPWKFKLGDKELQAAIKHLIAAKPATLTDLHAIIDSSLKPFDIKFQETEDGLNSPIRQLLFDLDLPTFSNKTTCYYQYLLNYETLRFYNSVIASAANWETDIDRKYRLGKVLNSLEVTAKQADIELQEELANNGVSAISFTLHHLKHRAIQLYFSFQAALADAVEQPTSLEEFYLLRLNCSSEEILPLIPREEQPVVIELPSQTFSFSFRSDPKKLKTVIAELCREIQLLDQSRTSQNELFELLTAKNIKPGSKEIFIACQTKQFRYVLDKFSSYFDNLSLAKVDAGQFFKSKKGNFIKEGSLSVANSKGKLYPSKSNRIDEIFKLMA